MKTSLSLDWDQIVEEYHHKIFSYAVQFLGSRAEAEDATQEAFLKAYSAQATLISDEALQSWLYRIARNVCIDRKRWWKVRLGYLREKKEPTNIDSSDLSLVLRELVQRLPQRQREIFILRHWHDFSTEETAKIIGIDQGTVKSHLARAIKKLKAELT